MQNPLYNNNSDSMLEEDYEGGQRFMQHLYIYIGQYCPSYRRSADRSELWTFQRKLGFYNNYNISKLQCSKNMNFKYCIIYVLKYC